MLSSDATNTSGGGSDPTGHAPLVPGETATVTLSIPCAPEYVGTARLAILGVASRMGFSYDQVEDIRLAVGEACANAIERANGRKSASSADGGDTAPTITIRSLIEASRLIIEVEDHSGSLPEPLDTEAASAHVDDLNSQELGALLMEILVDEVAVESLPGGGALVRLIKYSGEA